MTGQAAGLFASVATLPPGYLRLLRRHIATHDPEVSELALTDIRPWDWPDIDASGSGLEVVPRTLYAGALEYPWLGPRADTPTDLQAWMVPVAGVGGMLTPSYRWDQIALDIEVWREAHRRGMAYYVRQEVGIDALGDHPRLRAAWEAYLVELVRRALTWDDHPTVLWSPYAWDLWGTPPSIWSQRRGRIQAAISTLVRLVKHYSGAGNRLTLIIDLQDGRGAQPHEPALEALRWVNLIKDCGASAVRINAEWFQPDLTPQPAEVMRARLEEYAAGGVAVGCCWEARYWLLPPPIEPQPVVNH